MDGTVKVTYIGHATVLIESGGQAILTDPNFAKRILCFFKRHRDLRYDPKKLPEISAVLISHTHVDHLDFESLNYIRSNVPIILPEGSGRKVAKFLPNPIIELSHWADHTINSSNVIPVSNVIPNVSNVIPNNSNVIPNNSNVIPAQAGIQHSSILDPDFRRDDSTCATNSNVIPAQAGIQNPSTLDPRLRGDDIKNVDDIAVVSKHTIKIQAMPSIHSSCGLIPYHFKSANGYVIEIGGKTIFFAGDTAYGPHFKDIGGTYRIDCALLPIGSYNPAFMMKRWHMDPVDALQAFADLGASVMIPIHWGTFRFSLESPDEPKEWLEKLASERGIDDKVRVMSGGASMEV